jgi:hypothetical protein
MRLGDTMIPRSRFARGARRALASLAIGIATAAADPVGAAAAAEGTGAPPEAPGAAAAFAPQFQPTLLVRRAAGPIRVDGEIDDAGWVGAARAGDFAEVSPGDQTKPPVESEAYVTYDEANLYVALIARDDPAAVRVSLCDRDRIFSDDYFGVMLDTYGDQAAGYELFVNPLGIQGDLRMRSSGDEDMTFDAVWDSRGHVTADGYQVELSIPFASLRFPDSPMQTWRVNFWRDHQREVRRRYAWAAQDRDNPCFMCQWGTLAGIENVRPGKNVDLIANVIGTQSGALASSNDPRSGFANGDPKGEASLNLRYGITSNASADAALNPDFSQVESDAGQIDVNSTFALFFPERRPFFQEGSDVLATWIDAIYTRSINDPEMAGKMAGQFGRTSVVYTAARDNNSPLIVPLEERSEFLQLDNSTSQIVRVRRSLRGDSFVGALATDRRIDGGGSGSAFGADGAVRFRRNYSVKLQALGSRTREPHDAAASADLGPGTFDGGRRTIALDGESFSGHALYASLERSARTWNSSADFWELSPTFRADNGFTTHNDYRQVNVWNGLFFRPNRRYLIDWEASAGIGRVWNLEGRFKDEWIRPHFFVRTTAQTEINLEHLVSRERFSERVFPGIRLTTLRVESRFSETLSGGFSVVGGRAIYRSFDAPELGKSLDMSMNARVKPTRRFDIQPTWSYSRMDSRVTDARLFEGYILRTRATYNFTREWFLRVIAQYNSFSDRLDLEPLLTYRVNPFTVFHVGMATRYREFEAGEPPEPSAADWAMSSRQFFAKLQYLFRT